MWYLIKVFKNKMRHTARKRRGKYMTLETGIRGEQSVLVTAANTAKTMGSGTLDVFATPALVALAEKTCWMSVADALGEGNGSVGTKLELEHTAPTPVGMTVTCESELVAVEGRKLTFKVALHDEKGPVGGGIPARCHRSPFCRLHDIFPRPGEVFLNEGGFGSTVKFPVLPKALPLGELAPKVTERARTLTEENYSSSVCSVCSNRIGGGSASSRCCSARFCASCKSCAACTLARNSSKYIAL